MPTATTETLAFGVLTVAAAMTALIAVIVIYVAQAGPRRANLAPAAAALSLFGPLVGIGTASKHLAQTFADMATSSGGGEAALVGGCTRGQTFMLLGDAAAALTLVLAAVLGWLGASSRELPQLPEASAKRLFALSALLILPVIAVGSLHEYVRTTNRIAVAVAEAPTANPGEPGEGPAVVEALVTRMTRGVLLGGLGAPILLIVLAGFSIASAVLAWKVTVPHSFRIAGTAILLVTAALAVAGILLFERPVLPPTSATCTRSEYSPSTQHRGSTPRP